MINVYLHGYLGKKFGKLWKLEVRSIGEAIRAIDINVNGKLREYWSNGSGKDKKYRVKIGDYHITDEKELIAPSGSNDIHILPVIKGSKSGPLKMIAGAILIVVGYYLSLYTGGGASFISKLGVGMMYGGVGLVIGGVVQLLTPIPNFSQNAGNDKSSFIFEGNSIGISQGGSIGLVYGRALVSPMPISISVSNQDQTTTLNNIYGNIGGTSIGGGGVQNSSDGYWTINDFGDPVYIEAVRPS